MPFISTIARVCARARIQNPNLLMSFFILSDYLENFQTIRTASDKELQKYFDDHIALESYALNLLTHVTNSFQKNETSYYLHGHQLKEAYFLMYTNKLLQSFALYLHNDVSSVVLEYVIKTKLSRHMLCV